MIYQEKIFTKEECDKILSYTKIYTDLPFRKLESRLDLANRRINEFAKMENGKKDLTMLIHSRSAKEKRERLKVNFKLEKVAEIKTDSLWAKLNAKDSSHYNTRFQDNEEEDIYYVLYNSNRSRVLIPLIYKDNKKQMFLSYYTFTPGDTTNSMYIWKTYPERKIEKIQDQKMDVIKDIRKFSINWLWNTQNFINDYLSRIFIFKLTFCIFNCIKRIEK